MSGGACASPTRCQWFLSSHGAIVPLQCRAPLLEDAIGLSWTQESLVGTKKNASCSGARSGAFLPPNLVTYLEPDEGGHQAEPWSSSLTALELLCLLLHMPTLLGLPQGSTWWCI